MKHPLLGKTLTELKEIAAENALPAFAAKQIADWLYKKKVQSIDEMTNISAANRARLAEKYEVGAHISVEEMVSVDGTKKYLFQVGIAGHTSTSLSNQVRNDNTAKGIAGHTSTSLSNQARNDGYIESVYIPDEERHTLCVSSQIGCKMNCQFCMTGKQGFHGNLSAGEIINQIQSIPESDKLTNLVFMGMGEPFDNTLEVMKALEILTSDYGHAMSPRRITVSTIGIVPGMTVFLEKSQCHLAISLHSPFDSERQELMPMNKVYSIEDILKTIKKYDFSHQRRVSFEYIMFDGLNDTMRHARELARILRGIECRVNLIRFHAIPGVDLKESNPEKMIFFREYLTDNGIITTIRKSRGEDIMAACGMLAGKSNLVS
ncbi:MAG: 23S rRNA (adenine(2503)-C(2))-methyltransferase RlmN [Prevotellaceae bacterium]|nr:23S rRNA (adenine(2503)-C(2))-methyltransferase RlmN [Prevotellaceae bacterium]